MLATLCAPARLPGNKTIRLLVSLLFLFASLIFIKPLCAQELSYKKYGVKEGLPSLVTYQCLQDKKGFIWFATNRGVSRFDGKVFKTFSKEDGLPDNEIIKLHVDKHDNVWFISFRGIPSVFYNDSIRQIDCKGVFFIVEDLVDDAILLLAKQVKNGEESLGYYQSQNKPGNWHFSMRFEYSRYKDSIPPPILRASIPTTGTRFYYSHVSKQKKELLINGRNSKKSFLFSDTLFGPFYPCSFIDVTPDKKGIVFNTTDFVHYADSNGMRPLIQLKKIGLNIKRNSDVNFIFCENDSVLWLCTTNKGLVRIVNFMDPSRHIEYYFSRNSCSSILKDNEGGYWITTLDDGVHYVPNLFFFNFPDQLSQATGSVKSIKAIDSQRMIAGYGNGTILTINLENLNTGILSKWTLQNKNNRVLDIWPYWNNRLIIASDRGLYMLSPEGEYKELSIDIGIKGVHVNPDSTILSGSATHTRLLDLNKKTQRVIHADRVTCVASLGTNYFWGTLNGAYGLIDDSTVKLGKKHIALKGNISHIDIAPDSALWFSTPEGIIILKQNRVHVINKSHGLLSNRCKHILFDSLTAWVSTDQGISKVNYQWDKNKLSFSISNIMEVDGLLSSDVNQTALANDYIWAATENGISFFSKNYTSSPYALPPVRVHRIISGNTILPLSDTIKLNHKRNDLIVELFCPSYRSCGNISYKYRLNDLDTSWRVTTNNYIEFSSLPFGQFVLEVYAINNWGQKTVSSKNIVIINSPPFWKSTWFSLTIYIVTCLLVALVLYSFNLARHHKKEQSFKMTQKMRDLEIMALRAQMNPHFIFNCMSSIQYYILRTDVMNANLYLHKFSALIRKILQYSNVSTISMAEEIKLLELYLELEKMRLLERMEFRIIIKGNPDIEHLLIPPMIIQPYIENAIQHGITPLQNKKGTVIISFEALADYIHCTIEDNGIGINVSRQNQHNNKGDHISMGNSITEHRISIINSIQKNKILLKIVDKQDLDPADTGTIVLLSFPVINE